jgi:hypothetical protein
MRGADRALAALAGALLAPVPACIEPETCPGRGAVSSFEGVVSYAIGTGAGSTMSQTITVYDYTEGCTYDSEQFPISIGSCTLWIALEHAPEAPSRYFPGNPSAWAGVLPGQVCDLPLLGGTATVAFDAPGTIAFADDTTGVYLSGTISSWATGAGATGPLEWQFQSSGWP